MVDVMQYLRKHEYPEGCNLMGSDDFDAGEEMTGRMNSVRDALRSFHDGFGFSPRVFMPFRFSGAGTPRVTEEMLEAMLEDSEVLYFVGFRGTWGLSHIKERLSYVYRSYAGDPEVLWFARVQNVVFFDIEGQSYLATKLMDALKLTCIADYDIADSDVCNWEEHQQKVGEAMQDMLTGAMNSILSRQLRVKREKAEHNERDLRTAQATVIQLLRELERLEIEIAGYESAGHSAEEIRSRATEMAEELCSYDNLLNVQIMGSSLVFTTGDLAMKVPGMPGVTRPLGSFTIMVDMDNSEVVFTSLENKLNLKKWGHNDLIPHPHCNPQGKPCMGNMATALPDLVAAHDILGIWQIVLSFLTSYNPNDSWGKRARYWDAVDADGNIVEREDNTCHICGQIVGRPETEEDEDNWDIGEDGGECPQCGQLTCPDCLRYVDEEGYWCTNCASPLYCDRCDEYHYPGTTFHTCDECGGRVCEERAIEGDGLFNGSAVWFCCDDCQLDWERNNEYDHEEDEEEDDDEVEVEDAEGGNWDL